MYKTVTLWSSMKWKRNYMVLIKNIDDELLICTDKYNREKPLFFVLIVGRVTVMYYHPKPI